MPLCHEPEAKAPREGSRDGYRVVRSADLLGNAKVLTIMHRDEAYRLQVTAAGKLILTK